MKTRRLRDPRFILTKLLYRASRSRWFPMERALRTRLRLLCTEEEFVVSALHGFRMRVSPREYESHKVFFHGEYDPVMSGLVRAHLAEGQYAWDIGAERGWFALLMGTLVGPSGRVDAWEGYPPSWRILNDNIELNSMEWVHAHQCVVSDRHADAWFVPPAAARCAVTVSLPESRGLGYLSSRPKQGSEAVRTVVLDDFAEELGLRRLDFVKVDVEGSEPAVLRGAMRTLTRFRPWLVVEFNPEALERADSSVAELDDLIDKMGYERYLWRGRFVRFRPSEMRDALSALGSWDVYCMGK